MNDREAIPAENRLVWLSTSCLCRTTCLRHAYKFISMCKIDINTHDHIHKCNDETLKIGIHFIRGAAYRSCTKPRSWIVCVCVCVQHTIFFYQSSSKAQAANVLLCEDLRNHIASLFLLVQSIPLHLYIIATRKLTMHNAVYLLGLIAVIWVSVLFNYWKLFFFVSLHLSWRKKCLSRYSRIVSFSCEKKTRQTDCLSFTLE